MAIQFSTFEDKNMKPDKYYYLKLSKNLENKLVEVGANIAPIPFENTNFINIEYDGNSSIEIWEKQVYNEREKHINVTHSVEWYILKPENRVIINSNRNFSGYVKFI